MTPGWIRPVPSWLPGSPNSWGTPGPWSFHTIPEPFSPAPYRPIPGAGPTMDPDWAGYRFLPPREPQPRPPAPEPLPSGGWFPQDGNGPFGVPGGGNGPFGFPPGSGGCFGGPGSYFGDEENNPGLPSSSDPLMLDFNLPLLALLIADATGSEE